MPLPLLLLLYPLVRAIARIAVGAPIAIIVYTFLTSQLDPLMLRLENEIYSSLGQLSSLSELAYQTVLFLDFSHCVKLVLATSAACLSIKLFMISVRAFGVNV